MFEKFLQWASTDPAIVGFVLCGSRGKGFTTEYSDYDCALVVKDAVRDDYAAGAQKLAAGIDVAVYTVEEFEEHANWGGPTAGYRYDFAHLKANVDKLGGRIQRIIDEKSRVPKAVVHAWSSF